MWKHLCSLSMWLWYECESTKKKKSTICTWWCRPHFCRTPHLNVRDLISKLWLDSDHLIIIFTETYNRNKLKSSQKCDQCALLYKREGHCLFIEWNGLVWYGVSFILSFFHTVRVCLFVYCMRYSHKSFFFFKYMHTNDRSDCQLAIVVLCCVSTSLLWPILSFFCILLLAS